MASPSSGPGASGLNGLGSIHYSPQIQELFPHPLLHHHSDGRPTSARDFNLLTVPADAH